MKLFIDPVYTGRPSTCSTSYLVWDIIETLAAKYDDAFFYLLAPPRALDPAAEDKTEWDFVHRLPDRVRLLPYNYTICRTALPSWRDATPIWRAILAHRAMPAGITMR